jgi:hypothetical protein
MSKQSFELELKQEIDAFDLKGYLERRNRPRSLKCYVVSCSKIRIYYSGGEELLKAILKQVRDFNSDPLKRGKKTNNIKSIKPIDPKQTAA